MHREGRGRDKDVYPIRATPLKIRGILAQLAMNSNTAEPALSLREPAPMAHAWKSDDPAAWREFAAGMAFLRRYSSHNTGDPDVIGRNNLRLLHRSLLQDSGYRQLLKTARRGLARQALPFRFDLTASEQLQAHLISIPPQSCIRLASRPGYLGMFLLIHGAASTIERKPAGARRGRWPFPWQRRRQQHAKRRHLRPDDIVCIAHGNTDTEALITGRKPCIVLAVFTPLQTFRLHPAKNPGPDHPARSPLHGAA